MSNEASKIPFLITMDTEGDNLWENCGAVTTENSAYLPRFQTLCEAYCLRPTWLTTFDMCHCPMYLEFAIDCIRRDAAEIGTHLHAWDSPPLFDLTGDDCRHKPFLTDYPNDVVREKLQTLTKTLQDIFGESPLSHRAGRYSINAEVVRQLVELEYQVDCSVTPGISWRHVKGNPDGEGGADFSRCPREPYWMSTTKIEGAGDSSLLQIPISIYSTRATGVELAKSLAIKAASIALPRYRHRRIQRTRHHWLRPNLSNSNELISLLELAKRQRWSCVEFMLHSSELMPGGSPNFPTSAAIDLLYANMERTFATAVDLGFFGMTLAEFRTHFHSERSHRSI